MNLDSFDQKSSILINTAFNYASEHNYAFLIPINILEVMLKSDLDIKPILEKFSTDADKVYRECRKVSDIEKCIKLYDKNNIDISMVVTKSNHHPSFNMVSKKNHKIFLLNSKKRAKRRQEFNDTFNLTTVSITTNPNIILKKNYIFDCKVGAIEIPNSRAHDIDDLNDFKYCEFLFKTKNYDKFLK